MDFPSIVAHLVGGLLAKSHIPKIPFLGTWLYYRVPTRDMPPLYYLLIFDTAVISLLSVALSRDPHSTAAFILIPTLLVANVVVIWKLYARRRTPALEGNTSSWLFKLAWLGAAGYTTVTAAMIVSWIRQPDMRSAVQSIFGIVLSAYAWFAVRRWHQKQSDKNVSK